MTRAVGCDLSHHDGHFRPQEATGIIDFAIQKVTEGISWVDPLINEIWSGVEQIGIRGAYHYQRSGLSWLAQVDHFLETSLKYDFHFHAIDVEEINNAYSDSFFADTRRMVEYVANNTKKPCFLYTNDSTFDQMYLSLFKQIGAQGLTWAQSVPLWIANPATAGAPNMPKYRQTWDIHQYAWTGLPHRWGAGAFVDENVFNGDVNTMRAYLHLPTEGGSVPQEGETMAKYYKLDTTAANIRTGAGASYTDKGDLVRGDVIEEIERLGSWSKYKVAQHADGSPVELTNGTLLDATNTVDYWSTNAYFVQVAGLPNPTTPTDPPADDPDYIVAYWNDGRSQKYIPE